MGIMPDFFSHMFLGKATVPSMPSFFQEAVGMDMPLFHLGCQGPDIFFYYKMLCPGKRRRVVSFANLCHGKETKILLLYGATFLKEHPGDREFAAYWAGFLCHYALDCCAHPFVNERTKGFKAHKRLELHLDAYMLRKKWSSAPYRVRIQRLIEHKNGLPSSIVAFWQGLAREVYACDLTPETVDGAYRGMCTVTKLYYTPRSKARWIKTQIGRLFGLDISPYLLDFDEQAPLLDEAEYMEFEARFADAYTLAAPLCARYASFLDGSCTLRDLESTLPDINFSGEIPQMPFQISNAAAQ